MKILHITNNYPSKNYPIFGIFVKEQVDSLQKLGIFNEVFFINTREKGRQEYLKSLPKIFIKLMKNKYDLIHCHHAYSGLFFLLSGFAFFKKFIVSYQSHPNIEGGSTLLKLFLKLGGKVIFKNMPLELKNNKDIFHIPNGVDINFFKPIAKNDAKSRLGLDSKKKYIIFFDSYDKRPYKRVDIFDSVIKILREKFNLNYIEPLKLTNTSRKLVPLYLNASEVHLLTSDVEGSPNSVKEALSCNTKVVSTNVGDVKMLLSDLQGYYVSSSNDPEELAELVIESLKFESTDGRKRIEYLSITSEKIAEKLYNLYKYLMLEENGRKTNPKT